MKKAAIYVRVSTTKQDQDGYSVPLQKERLIAYCKAKGWAVAGLFVDPGHSGSSMDRPDLNRLIEEVRAGQFDVVLVYKLDRLSRSQKDTLFLIEDVFMASGVDFVSMQESFDTSTIYGRAMVGILSVFAQMERETITERTLMGRAGRAEDGLWHGGGTDPIGYDYIDGSLVINPAEAQQVLQVYELFAAGHSVTEITRRMEGCCTKHGDWSHTSTVGNILDNPLYSGTVHFDGVRQRGKHEAIVPPEIDQRVKDRRLRMSRAESSGDSQFLLTGFIFCDGCGARYFPHRRPNGTVVYSCHSRAKKNRKMVKNPNCKAPHIPVAKLDAMVEAQILRMSGNPSLVDEEIKKGAAISGSSGAGSRSEEVARIDAEICRLMDQLQQESPASVGEVAAGIAEAHKERTRLLSEGIATRHKPFKLEAFKRILSDVSFAWPGADLRAHRSFLAQLVDGIHIGADHIRVECSVEGLGSSSPYLDFSKRNQTVNG